MGRKAGVTEGIDGAGPDEEMRECAHIPLTARLCLSSTLPSTPCRDWTRAPGAAWSRRPE